MLRTTKRTFLLLALLCGLLAGLPAALAQDATDEPAATMEATAEATATVITDLSYNSPVTGQISDQTPSESWPLQTASADRIRIRVERTDGNLLPGVIVLAPDGSEVANSYGPEPAGDLALIENVALPAAGSYQVQVSRDGGETGVTEGSYSLTVIPLATADDNINNTSIVGPVQVDTPIEGEITATHWSHRYTLSTPAPDAIRIIGERTSGTLAPEVELLDSNGASLRVGYTEATGDRAVLDTYTLPAAGEYTVIVRRARGYDGDTEGGYRLTVEMVGAGEGNPTLDEVAGEVEYDLPLSGELTNAQWYQDWTLTTEAADTITLRVERAAEGGNLQPEVILLGGSGQEIRRGYVETTGDHAVIERIALDTPGTYTVRAVRSGNQTGATTGAYTLTVELVGAGEGSESLAGSSGKLEVGATVEGEITPQRWADTWEIQANADETLVFEATRTGGTLMPLIEIRDSNGQTLTSRYYNDAHDTATLEYRVPNNGAYRVVVLREGEASGYTTGTYELSVSRPTQ